MALKNKRGSILHSSLKGHQWLGFPDGASGKELACQCRRHKRCMFYPSVSKIPWRRAWQPTSVFLPGESQGRRSPVGYSPCGHKESDTTELLTHTQMTEHNVGTTQPVHKPTVCEKWNFQIPKGSENGPGGHAGSRWPNGITWSFAGASLPKPLGGHFRIWNRKGHWLKVRSAGRDKVSAWTSWDNMGRRPAGSQSLGIGGTELGNRAAPAGLLLPHLRSIAVRSTEHIHGCEQVLDLESFPEPPSAPSLFICQLE